MENILEITDSNLVAELGYQAQMGQLFAFFDEPLFAAGAPLGWVQSFADRRSGPRVVSLLDIAGSSLPGVKHTPLPLRLDLGVLVTDKEIYREGVDTVHLTALDPLSPSTSRRLVLELDGTELRKVPIRLNLHGMATVPLSHLPVGRYSVRFEDSEAESIGFTVAEYRLASLIATLESKSFEDGQVKFTLALNSFGHPVNGEVRVESVSQGRSAGFLTLPCRDGILRGCLPLKGEGPYSLNLQLVSEPSKTATVALSGTRASERLATVFGRLGFEIEGTLLPKDSSETAVKGIYLREGATINTPFALERLDSRTARITARSDAQSLTLVVADPAVARRSGANASSDIACCELYKSGRRQYREGHYSAALVQLEKGREEQPYPHCNYAYHIARCYARLGRSQEALAWLRRALNDGWTDWRQMEQDTELESLQTEPAFALLCQGGRREIVFHQVEAGQEIEIEVPLPMAFLALGGYVNGKPFEGWSFLLPPSELEVEMQIPERVEPGQQLEIEIQSNKPGGVYLLVKDQRLQSTDTPSNRLAAGLKKCAQEAWSHFAGGDSMRPFQELAAPSQPDFWVQNQLFNSAPERPGRVVGRRPGLIPRPGAPVELERVVSDAPPALSALMGRRRSGNRPMMMLRSMPVESESLFGFSDVVEESFEEPYLEDVSQDLFYCEEGGEDLFGSVNAVSSSPLAVPAKKTSVAPAPTTQEDPETLYAGILETRDGRVAVKIDIPDNFGQYHIEATVLSGGDWSYQSRTCQAATDLYVSIEAPPFVHPRDRVRGRLLASPDCEVKLYLDEELQQLDEDFSFEVKTGVYRAVVTSSDGASRTQTRRVDEPGRLTRVVQSVQLLTKGQAISLEDDPSILSLQVLPGLQKPFKMLIKETANYGHLCCEQTAAKMVSAALMVLSGDNHGEAVFIAGYRRMESMFHRSGGFSMYPGRRLDHWWSPRAVVYLLGLSGLEGNKEFSPAMNEALRCTLDLAQRSRQIYNISWPAAKIEDCQTAYWSLRQSNDPKALGFVTNFIEEKLDTLGGRVETRAQACYAAATLLLSKTHIAKALELTNRVLDQLEGGRLYSTYDSVAAIVLMNELRRAGIGAGGTGKVEVDGRVLSTEEAMKLDRFGQLRCVEKVCAVNVTKLVEESWESFDSTVPMRLSLQKNGQPSTSFQAGDAVELKIELQQGYQTGDLVWVCLPDSLSRLLGGGQVKRFSVDFEGLTELTIPLAATGVTGEQGQHFAVCVRNMFEEERVGSPGLLKVRVN